MARGWPSTMSAITVRARSTGATSESPSGADLAGGGLAREAVAYRAGGASEDARDRGGTERPFGHVGFQIVEYEVVELSRAQPPGGFRRASSGILALCERPAIGQPAGARAPTGLVPNKFALLEPIQCLAASA
jgi:hypothetical protein